MKLPHLMTLICIIGLIIILSNRIGYYEKECMQYKDEPYKGKGYYQNGLFKRNGVSVEVDKELLEETTGCAK